MNGFNSTSLTLFAATIADIIVCEMPRCSDSPLDYLTHSVPEIAAGKIGRVVIYNPDAVALWLFNSYREMFSPVLEKTQITVPFSAVMPSCTPVCFATMYTGALPEVHGIQKYEKPVVRTDSLYDALIRAGKKCAIVAVEDSSMSQIFLERDMDYFTCNSDEEVRDKAVELIRESSYDLLSVYTSDYDSHMHKTGTTSPEAIECLKLQIDIFHDLAAAIEGLASPYSTLLTFSPDHGVHNLADTRGAHGDYIPEDINILHFFGVFPGK